MVINDRQSLYMTRLPIPRHQHTPPPPALGRRERHKTDVRNRLLRAAFQLFATRGFQATTVEDITQAADVAKGTFFNYFPTKELLLTQMSEHRLDILRVALAEARLDRKPMREAALSPASCFGG